MNEMDPLRFVKLFATLKHEGQKYGVLPYTHHLQDVEMVLREFGIDGGPLLEAAWLHDVVEDTNTKLKEIHEVFGEEVADLVQAVTDDPGANRKERKALTYLKIKKMPNAVILKLADRIANVRAGGKLVDMYKKEYEDFRNGLMLAPVRQLTAQSYKITHMYAVITNMWDALDKLMDWHE